MFLQMRIINAVRRQKAKQLTDNLVQQKIFRYY